MYSLLQQRQRDIDFRESANEQRQRYDLLNFVNLQFFYFGLMVCLDLVVKSLEIQIDDLWFELDLLVILILMILCLIFFTIIIISELVESDGFCCLFIECVF